MGCMIGAARDLDDHISDAATIATGISSRCSPELQAIKDASNPGHDAEWQSINNSVLDQDRQRSAVLAVLKARQLFPVKKPK